ncbi:Stage II sporulation protein E (SpoIIE) [Thermomonospora echinospora]|uniref:Stage II sporulation protein E (SpoIIE) n=1 Tax=Thermomonospora echinospora TaxID=1992 RepID=A0A1H6CA36_9ACTN|nr:PP2C family protein-serine/threonine phosphatase [Thermomonospora echinospora]SEG69859.1 Stage II sporulation protein E (SpoIIE) [Thermomonospora echinospora]
MPGVEKVLRMLGELLRAGHLTGIEQLPGLVTKQAAVADLEQVHIYVADLRQQVLRELTGQGLDAGEGGQELPIENTLAGRAFRDVRTIAAPGAGAGRQRYWVPILEGAERLGVLRADAADGDADADADADGDGGDDVRQALEHLASMIGLQLISKNLSSDSYARLRRTEEMNVAAEMQWALVPPRSFANGQVTISAVLEPAYRVGGDAFDYAMAGDTLHLAVFDAMGHNIAAGLTANLSIATCRNQRRQGVDLASISDRIERVLIEQFGPGRYITGVLADLDLVTGRLSWVNRGHQPPVLIRGGRWVTTLNCLPAHPMGTDLDLPVTVCREDLQPGDRILLYTDGVTEARDAYGREFGLSRFTEFIIRHQADGLSVPETLRRLMGAVLAYHGGQLQDDATVVFCEWHNPIPDRENRVL